MRLRPLPLFLLLPALFLAEAARADTITLKGGEKIDGKVVKETATDYTVEYKVSAAITDTRTVLKTEVEKIDKVTPDEVAYESIKNVKPGATSLSAETYEATIRLLQTFLDQYPKNPHAGEIVQTLTAFTEEKDRVVGGEVKIEGKWASLADAQKERYQITARAVFGQMQEVARRGDAIGALNLFDQLEKNYPGARVYPDAVALAQQILPRLKSTADQLLESTKVQLKERETATQLMSDPHRTEVIAAQKKELQQQDATLESAAKANLKWPALQKHEKTLTAIGSKTQTELTRLEKLPVAKMRQSIQAATQAQAKLASKDEEGALTDLKQANSLWPVNEVAQRLQKELAAQRQAAVRATPTPVPAATPMVTVAATPRPTPPPQTAPTMAPPPPEEEKGFLSTPLGLGVVGLAVVGLGVGYLAYQKKKRAAQQFE